MPNHSNYDLSFQPKTYWDLRDVLTHVEARVTGKVRKELVKHALQNDETVPSEYLDMMLEEMGFQDRDPAWNQKPSKKQRENFRVLIIGAGMSGLCAAIKFQNAGIPFEIVEKNSGLGGTWFEGSYL